MQSENTNANTLKWKLIWTWDWKIISRNTSWKLPKFDNTQTCTDQILTEPQTEQTTKEPCQDTSSLNSWKLKEKKKKKNSEREMAWHVINEGTPIQMIVDIPY